MSIRAVLLGRCATRLWNIDAEQRLRRQLAQIGDVTLAPHLPATGTEPVLLLRADFLYEVRTLKDLLAAPDRVLVHADVANGQSSAEAPIAAAFVGAAAAGRLVPLMTPGAVQNGATPSGAEQRGQALAGLTVVTPASLGQFDHQLRKAKPPLLEPVSDARRPELESLLYGSAYKGITDLVTKFVWPRPARLGVRVCARVGISPNSVTALGFLLMLAACWLFWTGHYAAGLAAGWFMTYLDTVDGKLARVTVRSSRFGHLFDHGMDLIHPPFWYVLWGAGLTSFEPVLGLSLAELNVLIVAGYVGGRAVEGLFHLLGDASIFSWRPFDAYFRLITARRNPCMILLTLAVLVGRPDWGLVAVALWTALTTAVLCLRLLQGLIVRLSRGPLVSWLADPSTAADRHRAAYRLFSGTQSAYASR